MAQSKKMDVQLFGHSVDWWNGSMLFSLALAAVAAVFVVASTTGVIIIQKRDAVDSRKRIEELRQTNLKLEANVEELQQTNLKLEAQIAPRRLNESDISEIAAKLAPFAGKKVKVSSHPNDVDAAILGATIMEALSRARLEPFDRRMTYQSLGSIGIGVMVSGSDATLVKAILDALPEKLGAKPGEPPPGYPTILPAGEDAVKTEATIFVGVKPLP